MTAASSGDAGGSGVPLPHAPPDPSAPLPVRMVNEFAYCPRLFHLMHVDGRWADNVYTIEGKQVHRRVDQLDHLLPDAASGDAIAENEEKSGDGERPDSSPATDSSHHPAAHDRAHRR